MSTIRITKSVSASFTGTSVLIDDLIDALQDLSTGFERPEVSFRVTYGDRPGESNSTHMSITEGRKPGPDLR